MEPELTDGEYEDVREAVNSLALEGLDDKLIRERVRALLQSQYEGDPDFEGILTVYVLRARHLIRCGILVPPRAPEQSVQTCIIPRTHSPGTEDVHHFTLVDVLRLEKELATHEMFEALLSEANKILKEQAKRPLDLRDLAVIAAIFRKNIRQQDGAVPFRAVEQFYHRSVLTKGRTICNLLTSAAVMVLEGTGFMVKTQNASRANNQCARYKLLDHRAPGEPTSPDPKH